MVSDRDALVDLVHVNCHAGVLECAFEALLRAEGIDRRTKNDPASINQLAVVDNKIAAFKQTMDDLNSNLELLNVPLPLRKRVRGYSPQPDRPHRIPERHPPPEEHVQTSRAPAA